MILHEQGKIGVFPENKVSFDGQNLIADIKSMENMYNKMTYNGKMSKKQFKSKMATKVPK